MERKGREKYLVAGVSYGLFCAGTLRQKRGCEEFQAKSGGDFRVQSVYECLSICISFLILTAP